MFDKLAALEERFELVSEKISDPDVVLIAMKKSVEKSGEGAAR